MGMGEPAHNLPAVIEAAEHLGLHGGVGHKDLVVSTVGDPDVFARLAAARVRPALALSLHTTRAALRRELLPRAPLVEPRELLRAALAYARRTGHPLQLQWTLLAGVNDGDDELGRLVAWLRGEPVVVDFIPLNPVPGGAHRRTAADRVHAMTRRLHRAGITAKVRRSAAADVEGACGQLRARSALAAR
jgi:23S rRNA (adenine2503-C2)-methyltransferase